jgi:hypothetical protein
MATPTKLPSSGRMQKDTPAKNDSVSSRLSTLAFAGGGKVPTGASPSGGRKIDDVKARLSPGEFVIPKAAVAARGPGYWASQELAARGKPVTSRSVASAVYAPQRGGTQRFREGGESGDSGDSGDSGGIGGFGNSASGFAPSPGVSGNASEGWGGATGGLGIGGYGSVGGSSSGNVGWGGMSIGPAGGEGGGSSVGGGAAARGGGSVGGVGNAGGFGGGGSSGGGGASVGYGGGGGSVGYGGVGGASAGSAGGTGPGRGGIYGASQIGVPNIPGILANTGPSGAVVTAPTNAYATMSPDQVAALKAQLTSLYGGVPSGWGQRGVSVPSSLTGSQIGVASEIGVPSMSQAQMAKVFGLPGNFGQVSVPSSLTGSSIGAATALGGMPTGTGDLGLASLIGVPSIQSATSASSAQDAPSIFASNISSNAPPSTFGSASPSAPAATAATAAARGTGGSSYNDPRIGPLMGQIFVGHGGR